MKKLTKRWQMLLYGCSGLGLNMLNIILGTHLCNGLIKDGFDENVEFWTLENRTIVVVGAWMALSLIVKIFDGVVDIPLSTFTDNLRTRWGRRRPAILIGLVPLVLSYVLFLVPLQKTESSILNTIWFVLLLGVFYASYTLTMVTYYATFAEIVESERDRNFISTVKSICDVVYFSLNFALVPVFVNNIHINIKGVALIFLPLALTMIIPLIMIKEKSTKDGIPHEEGQVQQERVGFITSLKFAFKNKQFVYWLCIVAVMNIGLQLFLGGISVYFSKINMGGWMSVIMACSFVPVPFTLMLYNFIMRKRGLRFAFQYILLVYSIGMVLMMGCHVIPDGMGRVPYAILCAIIVSFAIGAFFSITYTVPSQLAYDENKTSKVCASTMYFAVQGLFEAISASIATQGILIAIRVIGGGQKEGDVTGPLMNFFPLFIAFFCMTAFVMTFFLSKRMRYMGKKVKDEDAIEKTTESTDNVQV